MATVAQSNTKAFTTYSGSDPKPFDLYCNLDPLLPFIHDALRRAGKRAEDARVLIIGVGLSRLPYQLLAAGIASKLPPVACITCIDKDASLIQSIAGPSASDSWPYINVPQISYLCMNSRSLDLPSESYDLVIDKAFLDSLACLQKGSFEAIAQTCRETIRVLKPGAVFISVSSAPPEERTQFLLRERNNEWTVRHATFMVRPPGATSAVDERLYHVYMCDKPARSTVLDDSDED
eukprot:ANDGO_06510.mRNA.1 hypothetical protein AURANDRAFT_5839